MTDLTPERAIEILTSLQWSLHGDEENAVLDVIAMLMKLPADAIWNEAEWKAGYKACMQGIPRDECPLASNGPDPARDAWIAGWNDAADQPNGLFELQEYISALEEDRQIARLALEKIAGMGAAFDAKGTQSARVVSIAQTAFAESITALKRPAEGGK